MADFWGPAGISAVVAVLVSAAVSIWGVYRNIKHKSVIEERQRWRDALRVLIPKLVSATSKRERENVRDEIVLRLNPYMDCASIDLMDEFVTRPSRDKGEAVVTHFQLILKSDWERAKIEASLWPWRAAQRASRRVTRQLESANIGAQAD